MWLFRGVYLAPSFLNCTVCTITYCFLTFVPQLMLDSWNHSIFSNIKHRLQGSAMKLVRDERYGDAFDTQLVIGVRESYGKSWRAWCSTCAYQKHVLMTVLPLVVFLTVIYAASDEFDWFFYFWFSDADLVHMLESVSGWFTHRSSNHVDFFF